MLVDRIPDDADYWESDSPEYRRAQQQIFLLMKEEAVRLPPDLTDAQLQDFVTLLNGMTEANVTFDLAEATKNRFTVLPMITGYIRETREGVAGMSSLRKVEYPVADYFDALTDEEQAAAINMVFARRKALYHRDLHLAYRTGDAVLEAKVCAHLDDIQRLYEQMMRRFMDPSDEDAPPFDEDAGGGLMVAGQGGGETDPTVEAAYWREDDELSVLSEYDDPSYWRSHPDFLSAREDIARLTPEHPVCISASTDPETLGRYKTLLARCRPEHVFFNLCSEDPPVMIAAVGGYVRGGPPVDPFEGGRRVRIGVAREVALALPGLYETLSPAQKHAVINEMYTAVQAIYRNEQAKMRAGGRFSDAHKISLLISASEEERQLMLAALPSDWGEAAH